MPRHARASARPSAPDCDEKPIRPAGKARGAKVAFSPTAAVAMPRQLGPTSRAPWARTSVSSCSCRATPSAPVSAKPAEMTQSDRVPERSASSAAPITSSPGKADHAEVDRVADLLERAVGAHAGNRLAGAVDRVGGAREPAGEDVAEQLAADRAAPRGGADHGNRAGLEERPQRGGDCDVVALVDPCADSSRSPRSGTAPRPRRRRACGSARSPRSRRRRACCCSRAAPRR